MNPLRANDVPAASQTPQPLTTGPWPRIILATVRVTLGVLFLSVWVQNVRKGLYSADGFAGLTRHYRDTGSAPGIWKDVMGWIANHANVIGPFQMVGELAMGALLLVGVATRLVGLAAAGFLSLLWLSEVGVPNEWIWSLVFPVLAALSVAILSGGRAYGLDMVLLERSPLRRLPRWARG